MYRHVDLSKVFRLTEIYTAFEAQYFPNYSTVGETHDFWEIVIVLDGEIGVAAGSKVINLKSGEAILHEPLEFHRLWSEKNSYPKIVILSFNCENMPKLQSRLFKVSANNLQNASELINLILKSFVRGRFCVHQIKNENSVEYEFTVKKAEMLLLEILSGNVIKIDADMSLSAKNYSNIIKVLKNNVHNHLSIPQIAELCNMSEVNLKKTFSRYAGIGIKKYYNMLIMNEAIVMLKNGASIAETAYALNFNDCSYFSTAFKRITGIPPSNYKGY